MLDTDKNLKAAAAQRVPFTKVGSYVAYGHYEQDNNTSNGQEAIEWIVLAYDANSNRSLLISRYGLEARCYDEGSTYPTWEKSSIRKWLNSDFVNAAFTATEQAELKTVTISTPSYQGNSGGADTQDRIWLLSREEATQYFKTDDERKATATAYANANGAYKAGNGCCWWWLRSPGNSSSRASFVFSDGSLYAGGLVVTYTFIVVRPVFWLDLSSL